MAHFAELDNNNLVTRVIVIDNKDTVDSNGIESEETGVAFCKSLYGENTKWVQTSYNSSFRGGFAGIGSTYNPTENKFIAPPVNEENIISITSLPPAIEN
jgi:hypothetical protein